VRGKVQNAMIYPAVLLVVAVTVVALVIALVIPRFQEIYRSFDVELPGVTEVLLTASDVLVGYWYLVIGLPALLFGLHLLFLSRRGAYRFFVHRLVLRLPIAGQVVTTAIVATFARVFGTLVQAGVPHLDALGIVRDTSRNALLHASVEDIRKSVREGEGISTPMAETGLFDDLVVNMVDVGEQTGELDTMLLRVADAYDQQVDRKIEALFKVLEPALLILMAIFVGFIVFALFMPLLRIMSTLGEA
jgi:type IV pilus assembly protein PilC